MSGSFRLPNGSLKKCNTYASEQKNLKISNAGSGAQQMFLRWLFEQTDIRLVTHFYPFLAARAPKFLISLTAQKCRLVCTVWQRKAKAFDLATITNPLQMAKCVGLRLCRDAKKVPFFRPSFQPKVWKFVLVVLKEETFPRVKVNRSRELFKNSNLSTGDEFRP